MTIIDREREACRFLDALPEELGAVVIGGYAVNPWAVPRYSDDLDLVVPLEAEEGVPRVFPSPPWKKERDWTNLQDYAGSAQRFSRALVDGLFLTVDLLVGSVMDKTLRVPIPYRVFREHAQTVILPCVNARTTRAVLVADPVALCFSKCQPMRARDKDDIAGLLMNPNWNRDVLHRLCAAHLPRAPLAQKLEQLEAFVRDQRTLRLVRRRFPGLSKADLDREQTRILSQIGAWKKAAT